MLINRLIESSLSFRSSLLILFSARLFSAFFNPIDDCDEVFNFYEPLHELRYGIGLQTWEYSPLFALRSYGYILFHYVPISLIPLEKKIIGFYLIRLFLALICSICETFFYRSIERQLGNSVGRMYFVLSLLSVALFRSSTSFLNNSFSMYTIMLAYSLWFSNVLSYSVFFIALGCLGGWIYVAVLGVPIAFDILIRRQRFSDFLRWSFISGSIILIPLTLIDSYYYGQLVICPLNHLIYNVFSSHGPTLYGTEPWIYYIKNGLLNFNIVYPLCFVGIVLSIFFDLFVDRRYVQSGKAAIPYSLINLSIVLWMSLLWTQKHKEDRFLFPINALIVLTASMAISLIENNIPRLVRLIGVRKEDVLNLRRLLIVSVIIIHGTLSISRTIRLIEGYSAPIQLLTHSNSTKHFEKHFNGNSAQFCIGKDWFRFPSHFLLPGKSQLNFLRSEFHGQLPKLYHQGGEDVATRFRDQHFNDENREEFDRYIELNECDYLIDHDRSRPNEIEPNYSEQCEKVTSLRMILPSKGSVFHSFSIPFSSWTMRESTYLHLLSC